MPVPHADIRTGIAIDAPPERVWAVLTELGSYSEWNPFMTAASGDLRQGAWLRVVARLNGGPTVTFRPRILRIDAPRELRWVGALGFPGLFKGEHVFQVQPLGHGRSWFAQSERFSGLLLPFMGWLLAKNKQGYELMNQALKARAEQR